MEDFIMKQEIMEAVKKAKELSRPRNFTQSMDVIMNIKDLMSINQENRFDEEVSLPNGAARMLRSP